MKFTITRNSLVVAVKEMMLAIPKKPTIPVCSCIKFSTANDKQITLQATDSEVFLSRNVDALEIFDAVDFLVDAADFMMAMVNIPEQPLSFEVKDESIVCRYHGGKFKIHCSESNVQFFPAWPVYDDDDVMKSSISTDIFQIALSEAQPFAAVGGVRPLMNCVCINFMGDYIDFVATNGHALYKCQVAGGHTDKPDAVVVNSHIAGILGKLKTSSSTIGIVANKTNAFFAMGDTTLIARRIEGRYPAYDRVIPDDSETAAEFSVEDMISAIRRVSPMADMNMAVTFDIDGDKITVESCDNNKNKHAEEVVNCTSEIHMNVCYKVDLLLNCLSLLGESAKMMLTESKHPCKFTHKTGHGTITCIAMPLLI